VLETEEGIDRAFAKLDEIKDETIWWTAGADTPQLLAGTKAGLYDFDFSEQRWRAISLGPEPEPVQKIPRVKDSLLVFTASNAYVATQGLEFQPLPLMQLPESRRVSLIKLFFNLHDGRIWGLAGKLLFDAAGLILFFLSLSAFYSWYYPWKRRREKTKRVVKRSRPLRRLFKWFLKYHLKLGIWTAVILLIIGGTGMFMRPPLLVALANGSIPAGWYPGPLPDNPWDEKIQNALYDSVANRVLIATSDGLWAGASDFQQAFERSQLDVPIFVMGATVFEPQGLGGYLVGSFNGLYHWQRSGGRSIDLLTGSVAGEVSSTRPGDKMITGYFTTPDGESYINTHQQGIIRLKTGSGGRTFGMPSELK